MTSRPRSVERRPTNLPPARDSSFSRRAALNPIRFQSTVRVRLVEAAMLELEVSAPSSVSVYVPLGTSFAVEPGPELPPQLVGTQRSPISARQPSATQILVRRLRPPRNRSPANTALNSMGIAARTDDSRRAGAKARISALANRRLLAPLTHDAELQSFFEV
jgi:hypothetical protein